MNQEQYSLDKEGIVTEIDKIKFSLNDMEHYKNDALADQKQRYRKILSSKWDGRAPHKLTTAEFRSNKIIECLLKEFEELM